MHIVISALTLACVGLLLFGLASPSKALFWFRGTRSVRNVLLFYGTGFMVLLALARSAQTDTDQTSSTTIVEDNSLARLNYLKATGSDSISSTASGQEVAYIPPVIPGLEPVDVYLNLEQRGFETTKTFGYLSSDWRSKQTIDGIEYIVSTENSGGAETVDRIKATATILDLEYGTHISACKDFLKYIGSTPFDGNDPEKVAVWIDKNFNKKQSSITIATVIFTLYAPGKSHRMLVIERPESTYPQK